MSYLREDLPPITMKAGDFERLDRLANAAASTWPRAADFLARELGRANVVDSTNALPGLVTMGSRVEFRDDTTGQVRRVTLVYPDEADLDAGRISVLTPIGRSPDRVVRQPIDRMADAIRRLAVADRAGGRYGPLNGAFPRR